MTEQQHPGNRARALRLAGRAVGVMATALWLMILIASVMTGPDPRADEESAPVETALLITLVIANTTALAVAFVREPLGSRLLIATATLFGGFGIWSAGHNHLFAAGIAAGPYLVSGTLIWVAAHTDRPATPDRR